MTEDIEVPDVAVMVSRKAAAVLLDDWSEPVQVRIVRAPWSSTGWEMEIRKPFSNAAGDPEVAP